jgi:hypothetical protein
VLSTVSLPATSPGPGMLSSGIGTESKMLFIAFFTKAVVAILSLLSSVLAVGAVGSPVN